MLAAGCAGLRPAPPPEAETLLAGLKARQAEIKSFSLQGRGRLGTPRGSLRGEIVVLAERPDSLRLEAYGLFGAPVAFVVVRGEEVQAVNFLERRYLRGRVSSPRLASFLPLGLGAADLISLLSAAPLPAGITAARGAPPEAVRDLQLAAKGTGSAALLLEGPSPARLLFGQDAELLAASLGPPGSRIEALYSGWEGFGGLRFPTRFEFSEPARNCSLGLDVSAVHVNEPVPAASFVLEPPRGFKAVEAP